VHSLSRGVQRSSSLDSSGLSLFFQPQLSLSVAEVAELSLLPQQKADSSP